MIAIPSLHINNFIVWTWVEVQDTTILSGLGLLTLVLTIIIRDLIYKDKYTKLCILYNNNNHSFS